MPRPASGVTLGRGAPAARRKAKQSPQSAPSQQLCGERTYKDLLRAFEAIDNDHSGTLEWSEMAEWVRNGRMGRKAARRFQLQLQQQQAVVLDWRDVLRFFHPSALAPAIDRAVAMWGWPAGADPSQRAVEEHWTVRTQPAELRDALELFAAIADPLPEATRRGLRPPADYSVASLRDAAARQAAADVAARWWRGVTLRTYSMLAVPDAKKHNRWFAARAGDGAGGASAQEQSRARWFTAREQAEKKAWPPSPRALAASFDLLDVDRDGVLSLRELLPLSALSQAPLSQFGADSARQQQQQGEGLDARGGYARNLWLATQRRWLYDDRDPPPHLDPLLQ